MDECYESDRLYVVDHPQHEHQNEAFGVITLILHALLSLWETLRAVPSLLFASPHAPHVGKPIYTLASYLVSNVGVRGCNGRENGDGGPSYHPSLPAAPPANSSFSNAKSRKRSRHDPPEKDRGEGSSGGPDGGPGGRASGKKRRKGKQPHAPWACPFLKSDPASNLKCFGYTMARIVDVRQHIKRYHLQPTHCPTCGQIFDGEERFDQRDRHMNDQTCEKREFHYPGATRNQFDRICQSGLALASGPGLTDDERRWYKIWEILFGHRCRPDSPYTGPEFRERLRYTLQSVVDGGQVQTILQSYPPEQHQLLVGCIKRVLQAVQHSADRQDTAGGNTASETSQQPSSQLETGLMDFGQQAPLAIFDGHQAFLPGIWDPQYDTFFGYQGDQALEDEPSS